MSDVAFLNWSAVVALHPEILTFYDFDGQRVPMTDGVGRSGWGVIHALCSALEKTPRPWPICTDIKTDRAGDLCFYVSSATDEQHDIIEQYAEYFDIAF